MLLLIYENIVVKCREGPSFAQQQQRLPSERFCHFKMKNKHVLRYSL
jgi:hypothetical protein